MVGRPFRGRSPLLVSAFGAALFLVAVAHHAEELLTVDSVTGPAVALALDGTLALVLVGAGHRLSETDLDPPGRRTVATWCFGGSALFVAVIGATFLVRSIQGRIVSEPLFPLLIAAESGAVAGLAAGYYSAKARVDAREAEALNDAFAFVNGLLRHDLRNDLNVIRGYAERVDSDRAAADAESETDAATVVAGKADEALTRIETSRAIVDTLVGEPDLEPVDVVEMTAELGSRIEDTHRVTLTTDLPDRGTVSANAGLRSVLDNLLENAAEHNDADSPKIEVAADVQAETVRLVVRDNGPGIPDRREETILDGGGAEGGTGGLSLVAKLVHGYGGSVRIEDNDPRGTAVVLELPRPEAR
jgi:signal transduction histidine kinase